MNGPRIPLLYFCLLVLLISLALGCGRGRESEVDVDVDQFSQHIRTTEARSPHNEKLGFHLPEGFEAQLFASEPDIGKPLNMTFDDKGRMWLTQSFEYPFPDTTGAPGDRISILEDTNGDGQADKIDVFADSLNIPIGIVKVPEGVIAYSIPTITHFRDVNGDDRVDERTTLFKGFQYKDTHGMINNLVRSWDGWIHADHGFANISQVTNGGPDTLVMQSGNTFRFKRDGSALEFTTTGRVNPYGYAYDELGYTYSTDCHTSPIYQLIRGADYPHFGKKPTGIGFGPALMKHTYGATALAGLEYYLGHEFPAEYQHSFYYGDVVKCRVYRATMEMQGTTPVVRQEEDFIISDDPWFRPVDVKMGPDGALYIADFYNSIIGHYEVPLDHPARDRYRGRIWRIVYNGDQSALPTNPEEIHDRSLQELISKLDHPQLPFRMSVADKIVDQYGSIALPALLEVAQSVERMKARVQGLWMLHRLSSISDEIMLAALQSPNDTVQVHALRILYELKNPSKSLVEQAHELLQDENVHVQRQSVMVLSKDPDIKHMSSLLKMRQQADARDTHFMYSIRQALRDQLRDRGVRSHVLSEDWEENDLRTILDVIIGVDHADASVFITRHLPLMDSTGEPLLNALKHAAHFAKGSTQQSELVKKAQSLLPNNSFSQLALDGLVEGFRTAGKTLPVEIHKWSASLVQDVFSHGSSMQGWACLPYLHLPYTENPWRWIDTLYQGKKISVLISDALGWQGTHTSILKSPRVQLQADLQILLIGHRNVDEKNDVQPPPDNRLELRTVDGELLQRNDITTPDYMRVVDVRANLTKDQKVYFALVDGSSERGEYIGMAALGSSPFSWPSPDLDRYFKDRAWALEAIREYELVEFTDEVHSVLKDKSSDITLIGEAAKTLLTLDRGEAIVRIGEIFQDTARPRQLHQSLLLALASDGSGQARELLARHLSMATYETQRGIARRLVGKGEGVEYLLAMAGTHALSPRILLESKIREPMSNLMTTEQREKLASITKDLRVPGADMDALISKRLKGYGLTNPDLQRGQMIEIAHCSPCHSIDGEGGNIGPQIDGIGNWGARALTEKILDPNRNISKAFVSYTIHLKDGSVRSGLFRREEGAVQVFADAAGSEFRLSSGEIKQKVPSPYTLMPDHFAEVIPEADYYDLLAFLLQEK
ncbi:MAG: hypothetical protein HKN87_20270 [Saprospiraceae bacterium]|nr:hypothetical protein [Saprospiraceae bacterium]